MATLTTSSIESTDTTQESQSKPVKLTFLGGTSGYGSDWLLTYKGRSWPLYVYRRCDSPRETSVYIAKMARDSSMGNLGRWYSRWFSRSFSNRPTFHISCSGLWIIRCQSNGLLGFRIELPACTTEEQAKMLEPLAIEMIDALCKQEGV